MSFSSDVKTELCRGESHRRCCAIAECYGVLLTCNSFSATGVKIITEHPQFAERLPLLFKRAFSVSFDEIRCKEKDGGKQIFFCRIDDPQKLARIYETLELPEGGNLALHINRGVLELPCCEVSFVRGAFLSGGSVIDPEKRYHLELSTVHRQVSAELANLLLGLGFRAMETSRNGASVLYFKHSDQIEDLLTTIGAPVCAMKVMEAKVEKDMRNKINRRCNCDSANADKIIAASIAQRAAIAKLRERGVLEDLPDTLLQIVRAREADPEAPLAEIAAQLYISKSAASHRFRKLLELAEKGETR